MNLLMPNFVVKKSKARTYAANAAGGLPKRKPPMTAAAYEPRTGKQKRSDFDF
jgi:hypothetical protein